jgi:DNA-binding Lrp family transcriptional regulator
MLVVPQNVLRGLTESSEELGVKLLREQTSPGFHSEVRVRYSELASKVGAHKEIVRLAVKRAEKSQFIREWKILLNPRLIGQTFGSLQVESRLDESEMVRALAQIKLIEGVAIISIYQGGSLRVVIYYDSEESADRKIQLIASICGVKKEDTTLVKVSVPVTRPLKKTDWKVLKAISKNPRRKSADISSELRLSTRTVNRVIKKLTDSRAIFMSSIVDVENSVGLTVSYLIRCSEEAKEQVYRLVESQKVDFSTPGTNEYFMALLCLKNISEAEQFRGQLKKVPGVEEIRMYFLKEHIFVDSWLDEVIQKNAD